MLIRAIVEGFAQEMYSVALRVRRRGFSKVLDGFNVGLIFRKLKNQKTLKKVKSA